MPRRQPGLYNGFLVAGLVWGLLAADPVGFQVKIFFLACVIVAGLYGAATVNRRIIVVQAVPAALLMQRTEEGLDAGLVAIGDLAELEVATRAATVRAAIEPALVLGLAVLVGWVAAVLYLPLTRAIELLR